MMTSPRPRPPRLLSLGLVALFAACSGPESGPDPVEHFSVRFNRVQSYNEASGLWRDHDVANLESDPLPYAVPARVDVEITANPTGRHFTGYVQLLAEPGEVVSLTSETNQTTRTGLQIINGEPARAQVEISGGFGDTRIIVEDMGHDPGPAQGAACDNGLDDDRDGLTDYPDDPGCFLRNDNNETSGTHAVGLSESIWFNNPRLAHVQGCNLVPDLASQAITVERGVMYVTAVTVNGFYVTDVSYMNPEFVGCQPTECCEGGRYSHLYAYNFNTPQGMRVCDRLEWVGGIVGDFFGFTELSFPSWGRYDLDGDPSNGLTLMRKEPGDITAEDCPIWSTPVTGPMLTNRRLMETYEASLVHIEDAELPTEWVNCDFNGNGEVAFNPRYDEFAPAEEVAAVLGEYYSDYCAPEEGPSGEMVCSEVFCNDTCVERTCAELTNFREYGQYPVLVDNTPVLVVTSSNIPHFNPRRLAREAAPEPAILNRLGGVLKEFAPLDSPWIIEPRCPQDLYIAGDPEFGVFDDESVPIYRRCVPSEETGDYADPN